MRRSRGGGRRRLGRVRSKNETTMGKTVLWVFVRIGDLMA